MLELALWLKQERLPRRSGAGVLAGTDGDRDRDVSLGQEPAAPRHARLGRRARFRAGCKVRRLHKAFLRYHDPNNWPMLRAALKRMGRDDLIGNGKHQLVPRFQPKGTGKPKRPKAAARPGKGKPFRTQHVR